MQLCQGGIKAGSPGSPNSVRALGLIQHTGARTSTSLSGRLMNLIILEPRHTELESLTQVVAAFPNRS